MIFDDNLFKRFKAEFANDLKCNPDAVFNWFTSRNANGNQLEPLVRQHANEISLSKINYRNEIIEKIDEIIDGMEAANVPRINEKGLFMARRIRHLIMEEVGITSRVS